VLNELGGDAEFDFCCLVDSLENLKELMVKAREANIGRPLEILIEVGCANGRCGVRTLEQGLLLAEAANSGRPCVKPVGVECFEGVVQLNDGGLAAANRMLDLVVELATTCVTRGFFQDRVLLSAGGSGFFDLVAHKFAAIRSSEGARLDFMWVMKASACLHVKVPDLNVWSRSQRL
jgi:D-serine dehydratase